jgi:hypothetical protein
MITPTTVQQFRLRPGWNVPNVAPINPKAMLRCRQKISTADGKRRSFQKRTMIYQVAHQTSIEAALKKCNMERELEDIFRATLAAAETHRRGDEMKIFFGKYCNKEDRTKSKTLSEIYEVDPHYITGYLANNDWVKENSEDLYAAVQAFKIHVASPTSPGSTKN